ncbi:MAG: hypothetical protein NTX63_00505 [Candidatus Peregrinibacteria bacterium]|nr:hypothetical protein [Candidatus Peregrinibacteria bacterium]
MLLSELIRAPKKGEDIEQSNIFSEVHFSAIDKKLEAILVTPACDLAQKKADYAHLCAIMPFEVVLRSKYPEATEASKQINGFIKEQVTNRSPRYHWVGTIPGMKGYFVADFQLLQTIRIDKLNTLKRVGIVKSPLRESIPSKFASYAGRVGLPWGETETEKEIEQVSAFYFKQTSKKAVPQK